MIPHKWKIFVLLTIIFINVPVKCETCTLSPLTQERGYCTAQLDCQNNVEFDIKTWSCIRHTRHRNYDYYYGREREQIYYDENFDLVININVPRETDLFGNIAFIHFYKLSLKNGNTLIIPEDIYKMTQLTTLIISGTKISTVNFANFMTMPGLSDINLSNNIISVIELNENNGPSLESKQTNVKIIDISYNFIEVLPNNFVSGFTELQRLDLSHNLISSIDIHTFEGIVQLQTLDLSYNKLLAIGNAFARFVSLRELSLSNNNLTKLIDYNFVTLTNLENLNISFNLISGIEDNTFQSLSKLEFLDLGYNKLKKITTKLFENNAILHSLSLSHNRICSIEANSFKGKSITSFSIQNNSLEGAIEKDTFNGINVHELNLSGGNITSIKNEAFTNMPDLMSLNLNSNAISNISDLAFASLTSLDSLDLSHNKLKELRFQTEGMKNLTKLYAHHNEIIKITNKFFENFESLKELDLSFNELKEMEPQSFLKLNNVELITIKNSNFINTLESNALQGLTSLNKIDMSGIRTSKFKNASFSGLFALSFINSSFGQLAEIEYNAFVETGSLSTLILSNNQLLDFHVNVSTLSQIQEIYLNNNNIRNISRETFSHLMLLRNLNVAYNNIIQLSSGAFQYSSLITHLDLSSNKKMKIIGNPFVNLSNLEKLSLQNVKTDITFENSSASIVVLVLQSCGIKDINKVSIYNVRDISYLHLSMNDITTIDKDSFKNMPTLVSLDLSLNKIMYIQPGSFLHVNKLMTLNLFGNNLPTLQFGVFDGVEVLRDLNLSSNVLSNFDVKLLPAITKLSLDDNIITNLRFRDFFDTKISELSIGGNQILCKVLAELKTTFYEKFKQIVTAKTLDYHSENINGITCQTSSSESPNVVPIPNNPSINISPLISSLRSAIEKFDESLQVIRENSNKTFELKNEAKNVIKSIESFLESTDKNQIINSGYIAKLTDINNNSNTQLTEIKKYLELIANKKELASTAAPSEKINIDDQYNMRTEFQKMLKLENDALREEFKSALATISKTLPLQESLVAREHDKNTGDNNSVFYFIAVCLAVMVAAYLGNIIFRNVVRLRHSRDSRTRSIVSPISNSIEME